MALNWLSRITKSARNEFLNSVSTTNAFQNHAALVQIGSFAVLAVSAYPPVINYLSECMTDTAYISRVRFPNYTRSFFLERLDPKHYPEWSWDHKARLFTALREDLITEALRERSRLAVAKGATIGVIMRALNTARSKFDTGIDQQGLVYFAKYLEAKTFQDSGYDENRFLEFPYVLQYADIAKLSLRQAADEILLKARIANDEMIKTEFLRLKYFDKVKNAKKPAELPPIQEEFMRDLYITATI